MSQIEELQRRIAAALDRIGTGVEGLGVPAAEPAADGRSQADLAQALEEERLANAQLGERIKSIKARHDEELTALRDELDKSGELQALKSEAEDLRAKVERLTAEAEAARAELESASDAAETAQAEVVRLAAELAEARKAEALHSEMDRLKAEAEEQSDALARLDMDVQRVRLSNEMLRDVNASLREASARNLSEPKLINKAMLVELEGLRASRAADAAEAGAVLRKLESLLSQAGNLPEGEED